METTLYPKGSIPVFSENTEQGTKQIGAILDEDGERIFLKRVYEDKHLHQKSDSYGTDISIVEKLMKQRIDRVRIETLDTKKCLSCDFYTFVNKGFPRNYGYGMQHFVKQKYFDESYIS